MQPSLMSASLCDTCVYMIEFEAQNGLNHYDLRVTQGHPIALSFYTCNIPNTLKNCCIVQVYQRK